ncbi:hypothetical protein BTVI_00020 [Pitangus sulphuratus]|nr:hypothetical protein BTVI_00020 [Pitangus sulphuratus]
MEVALTAGGDISNLEVAPAPGGVTTAGDVTKSGAVAKDWRFHQPQGDTDNRGCHQPGGATNSWKCHQPLEMSPAPGGATNAWNCHQALEASPTLEVATNTGDATSPPRCHQFQGVTNTWKCHQHLEVPPAQR